MIEETVDRVRSLVPAERLLIVADAGQTRTLRKLLPKLPRTSFLVEPMARNTAPSIMLATASIWLDNPEAVIAILPADHLIREPKKFLGQLEAAVRFAHRNPAIVTFGIQPTYPATGYGYIQFSRDNGTEFGGETFYPVRAFREKPSLELADQFLAAGDCSWNSGMFVWRADVFARELETSAPDLFPFWRRLVAALKKKDARKIRRVFARIPATSIDYALMEKTRTVVVCEGDFGWSDVGAWSSLFEIWKTDRAGNATRGENLAIDSQGCLVYNPGRLTALIGVRDLIVVESGDALLVCASEQDQRVKEVVDALKKAKKGRFL
jgi:mannose-1-phosphate guanylyltransferase